MSSTLSRNRSAGYSLAEMLVVVAIIGIMSMVTVPQFIAFSRSNKIKGAFREFAADVRLARQRSIARNRRTAITFSTGLNPTGYGRGQYAIYEETAAGTWACVTCTARPRKLPPERTDPVYFAATTFTNAREGTTDVCGDDRPDIVFRPDGTIGNIPGSTGTVSVTTDYPISVRTYTFTFTGTGNFSTAAS